MKRIYLVRHAEAVERATGLLDFDRPLVSKGMKSATKMAKLCKAKGITADLMISSPASRALETAHIFAEQLGYPAERILLKDGIYSNQQEEDLLALVRSIDRANQSVMIFGHNPGLQDFSAYLVSGFTEYLPKSGVIGIAFRRYNWKNIKKWEGKLVLFDFPGRAKKVYRNLRAELATEFAAKAESVLARSGLVPSKKTVQMIEKSSKKLAKSILEISKTDEDGPTPTILSRSDSETNDKLD
jgi:phosphohistidine phosphatase